MYLKGSCKILHKLLTENQVTLGEEVNLKEKVLILGLNKCQFSLRTP